jgi:hypothetical protein
MRSPTHPAEGTPTEVLIAMSAKRDIAVRSNDRGSAVLLASTVVIVSFALELLSHTPSAE